METKALAENLIAILRDEIECGQQGFGAISRAASDKESRAMEAAQGAGIPETDANDYALFKPGVDLVTLLGEVAAVKAELRKETQAFRQTKDGFAGALKTLNQELQRSRQREKKLRGEIERARGETEKQVARALIAVADRLEPATEAAEGLFARGWWTLTRWILGGAPALKKGLELTLENINQHLLELGVSRILTLGKRFDPHLMTAVGTAAEPEVADGLVTRQALCGYLMKGEIFRTAQVVVNRLDRGEQGTESGKRRV